jgi:hypothetical protein
MSFTSYLNHVIIQATNSSFYVISTLCLIGRVYQIILFRMMWSSSTRYSVNFNSLHWNKIVITYQIYNTVLYNAVPWTSNKQKPALTADTACIMVGASNNMAHTLQPDINSRTTTALNTTLCFVLRRNKCNDRCAQFVEIQPVLF